MVQRVGKNRKINKHGDIYLAPESRHTGIEFSNSIPVCLRHFTY